jgi:hypothetical protein
MQCPICKFQQNIFKQIISDCRLPVWNSAKKLIRYQCPQCDVIFGTLEIIAESKQAFAQRYQKLYESGWRETDSTGAEMCAIEKLGLLPGQKCLNWGSGSISQTRTKAQQLGIVVDLYEPYDPYAKNVLNSVVETALYDGIISNNVMEHLQDPVSELIKMSSHLKEGGVMVHKTPCWNYVYEWTEYHLFFFVGRSVDVMAKQAGLVAVRLDDECIQFEKE